MNRRMFDKLRRARRPDLKEAIAAGADDRLPLADAARALRAAQRDSDLDRMSRGLSDSDESLLAFWARQVAQIGVPVHGRRILADRREIVPRDVLLAGRIRDEATRLDVGHGEPAQDFCDLQVSRRAFEACLRSLTPQAGSAT